MSQGTSKDELRDPRPGLGQGKSLEAGELFDQISRSGDRRAFPPSWPRRLPYRACRRMPTACSFIWSDPTSWPTGWVPSRAITRKANWSRRWPGHSDQLVRKRVKLISGVTGRISRKRCDQGQGPEKRS